MITNYKVAIIGGGPAALNAAIYASRANLSVVFIEKGAPGGKMVKTSKIENWIGVKTITGPDLSLLMFEHAQLFGADYKYGDVERINSNKDDLKEVILKSGEKIVANAVIIATGMIENVPTSVKGILKYENRGVSYCAVCDGPLFNGKPIGIIGGGNSAVEEGAFLAAIASKIYIFVKGANFNAEKALIEDLMSKKNVEVFFNTEVSDIGGDGNLEYANINFDGQIKQIKINALFPYIGQSPAIEFAKHLDITDDEGFIVTNEEMETSVKNVFAAGDIRQKGTRQIVTAAADGAIAAKVLAVRFA